MVTSSSAVVVDVDTLHCLFVGVCPVLEEEEDISIIFCISDDVSDDDDE